MACIRVGSAVFIKHRVCPLILLNDVSVCKNIVIAGVMSNNSLTQYMDEWVGEGDLLASVLLLLGRPLAWLPHVSRHAPLPGMLSRRGEQLPVAAGMSPVASPMPGGAVAVIHSPPAVRHPPPGGFVVMVIVVVPAGAVVTAMAVVMALPAAPFPQ